MFLTISCHFGPTWTFFGSFQTKFDFLPQKHKVLLGQSAFSKKNFVFYDPKGLDDGNGRNCFKPTSYMSKDYECATDSQNEHIYERDNQRSEGKGPKIAKKKRARFGLKTRSFGAVLAQAVFFINVYG